ncbi:MAG: hypothetical protein KJ025_09525 [Burkholderiales bacterium]|nr:hypothetical protein [Burkholderiales bacterium]
MSHAQMLRTRRRALGAATVAAFAAVAAQPLTASAQYFAGKEIEVVVPFAEGGATDVGAKFLAPFLEKHIAGNPRMRIKTRPGGGSILGANWFEANAKPDGLTILFTTSSTSHPYILGRKEVKYDLAKKRVAYSMAFGPVLYTSPATGVKSVKDLKSPSTQLVYGGIAAAASDLPVLLSFEVLKLDVKAVLGFTGRGPVRLAFERGETNFDSQFTPVFLTQVVPLVESGKAIPLYSGGSLDDNGRMTQRDHVMKDLPSVYEAHKILHGSDPSGPAWDAFQTSAALTFTYGLTAFLHEDTPQAIVDEFNQAVDRINQDAAFHAEAKKVTGGYPLTSGAKAEKPLRAALKPPAPVLAYMKELLASKYNVKF